MPTERQLFLEMHRGTTTLDREWLKNTLIITPVIMLMAWAGLYLYRDYKPKDQDEEEAITTEVLGSLAVATNNVKRKPTDSLYWNPAQTGEVLHDKDSIRTGPNSQALIKLNDSSIIEVGENSLIVLEKTSGKLAVDLKLGDMSAKSKSTSLAIKVKDSTVQSQNGELKLKTDNQNNTQILVTEGQATLTDSKGQKTEELNKQKSVKIDSQGKTETMVNLVALNTPRDQQILLHPDKQIQHPFTWTVLSQDLKDEVFELSPTKDFPAEKILTRKAHQAIQAPLSRGTWFWRVGWKTSDPKKLAYSEIRSVRLEDDARVVLTHPKNNAGFELDANESSISFSWVSQVEAALYVLEVGTTADLSKIIKTQTTPQSSFEAKDFRTGSYHWRVRAFSKDNKEVARSGVGAFTVKTVLPQLPALIQPKNGSKWTLPDPIELSWEKNPKATSYRVTISKDANQTEIVKTIPVVDIKYLWKWTQAGVYYWGVESLDPKGISNGQSLIYRVIISPPENGTGITLISPDDQSQVQRIRKTPMDPVSFQWQPDRPITGPYRIEIAETSDFKDPVVYQGPVATNKYSHRFEKSGTYYWRVSWRNPSDPKEGLTSSIATVKVRIINKLPAPMQTEPQPGATFVTIKQTPVTFSWEAVPEALEYRLLVNRVFGKDQEKLPIVDVRTKELTHTTVPLDPGQLEWTVQAVDKEEMEGLPSQTRPFVIEFKKELSAPKLKPPVIK